MTELLAPLAFGPSGWGDELIAGAWLTLRLALATLPIGLAIGLGVALMRHGDSRILRPLGELYGAVFRGLPELLTIFIVYFGAPRLATHLLAFAEAALGLPPSGTQVQIDGFMAGVLALALVLGAFSSEVFLGAIRSVPESQREAADALGMSRAQAFRLVILPQVMRLAFPGLANNWMTLLKDTSLVSVIALPELMRQANLAALATRQPFLFYLAACLLYLAMSVASERLRLRIEPAASPRGAEPAR
ncbi:ABC transporter permease subunit [Chelatococcus sambhunathii]|uniref:ABC transporter permease subunit n=1 Tax=Chelatococcus sambhunathii TaxID=363953 RepID=A0ABU1DEG1_9HYPH|nr:ABC transporter permease subunit [Chelatococcus sambhunathii]MDR4306509.1 ABC transporter permease subunit [Chelatococcus sambhunathii]